MEANTVVLSLSEYNALRDFKTNLEKGNTYRTCDYRRVYNGEYLQGTTFVSTDEAVKEVTAICEQLTQKIEELGKENLELRQGVVKGWDKETEKVKKMSIWEFLKWRKRK